MFGNEIYKYFYLVVECYYLFLFLSWECFLSVDSMEYVLVWFSFFCGIWEWGGMWCVFSVLLSDSESIDSGS